MIYPQQQAYREALQKYDLLMERSGEIQNKVLDLWVGDIEGENLDRYCEVAVHIECELGLPAASTAYHKAEQELLTWGLAYCRTHPDYAPVISIVMQLLETPMISYRKRACAALMRVGLFDGIKAR